MSRKGTNPLPTAPKPPAPQNLPLLLAHKPRSFLRCACCGQPILSSEPVVVIKGCSVGNSESLSFFPCYHADCVKRPNAIVSGLPRKGESE